MTDTTQTVLGVVITLVFFVLCVYGGHLVQWLVETEDALPWPKARPRVYEPDQWTEGDDDGPCCVCGLPGRAYGVGVWIAAGIDDGRHTYAAKRYWCASHEEQMTARVDAAISESVEV